MWEIDWTKCYRNVTLDIAAEYRETVQNYCFIVLEEEKSYQEFIKKNVQNTFLKPTSANRKRKA